MDKLSKGEQIAGGGALLLLVLSFFSLWSKYELGGPVGTVRSSGWDAVMPIFVKLAFILALVVLVMVGLKVSGTSVNLPVGWGQAYTGLGALITLLLLLGLVMGPEDGGLSALGGVLGIEVSRGIFLIISPLIGAAIAYGGYLHMQGETTPGGPATSPPAA